VLALDCKQVEVKFGIAQNKEAGKKQKRKKVNEYHKTFETSNERSDSKSH
jgi:hypothetical protein